MAGFSITGQMKVATLQKSFLKEFGLTLRIYQGRSFADPTQTLAQVRKTKGTGKALAVAKNMKVGNLEDKFEAEFGLKVQVAGSDDSYLCDNDLTLKAAQQEDDKKLARKERKAARQTDESGDKENLGPTRELKLRVEGFGGEFQYHRLNKEDADYAREDYNPKDEEDFLDANFNGGDSFDEAIWSGSYGPALSGIELINDDDETKINLDDVTKDNIFYTDGEENLRTNCLDYFYITEGKVFGSYTVVLPEDEIFDPKKLTIKYIEYFLDGYQEKYGTIIHEVEYDGEVCEAEIEDNGVDIYRSVVGYELSEGDLTDHIVIYDSVQQDSWEWDRCDEVFDTSSSDPADSDSEEAGDRAPTDESSELAGPEWVPMTDFTALRFGLTDDDSSEDFIENINPSANIHVAIAHKQGDDFLCILVDGQFLAIQDGDVDDLMTKVPQALKDMAGQELAEGFVKAAYEQDADGLVDVDEDLEEEFFAADEAEEVIWYSPCLFAVGSTTEDCEAEIDMHSGRVRDLSDGSIQDDLSMFFGRRDEDETWVVGLHR